MEPQILPTASDMFTMKEGIVEKASDDELENYKNNLETIEKCLWCSALSSSNGNSCQEQSHLNETSDVFDTLVEAVNISSLNLPQVQEHINIIIPVWNNYCEDIFSVAKTNFIERDKADRFSRGEIFGV